MSKSIIALIAILATFACKGSLTGPEEELVGTWAITNAEIGNLTFQIDSNNSDAVLRHEMRFDRDRNWQDNSGNRGTWEIEDGEIVLRYETGIDDKVMYYLDGDNLTLILTMGQFLQLNSLAEEDNVVRELFLIVEQSAVAKSVYQKK